jgi:hypothetical protein
MSSGGQNCCFARGMFFFFNFISILMVDFFHQLPEALAEFKSLMTAAGHNVNPKVTLSESVLPAKLK